VLGDRQSGGGRDKGAGGGNVDHPRAIAAGAAAIGEQIIGSIEGGGGGRQSAGGADHLVGGFAFHPERDQHSRDFGRLELAQDQPLEQMLAVFGGQILAGEQAWKRVGDGLPVIEIGDDGRGCGVKNGLKHGKKFLNFGQ